jgi:hypothetical protein
MEVTRVWPHEDVPLSLLLLLLLPVVLLLLLLLSLSSSASMATLTLANNDPSVCDAFLRSCALSSHEESVSSSLLWVWPPSLLWVWPHLLSASELSDWPHDRLTIAASSSLSDMAAQYSSHITPAREHNPYSHTTQARQHNPSTSNSAEAYHCHNSNTIPLPFLRPSIWYCFSASAYHTTYCQ